MTQRCILWPGKLYKITQRYILWPGDLYSTTQRNIFSAEESYNITESTRDLSDQCNHSIGVVLSKSGNRNSIIRPYSTIFFFDQKTCAGKDLLYLIRSRHPCSRMAEVIRVQQAG